ncbi:hypothetical protein ACM0IS_02025 [Mycoplasma aquilae ATCC BAA-1896]|uniref:hypothetical protein n=1 Tax=Mycoplasma aquilae TaxID=1312741 RepID=UPI003A89D32F
MKTQSITWNNQNCKPEDEVILTLVKGKKVKEFKIGKLKNVLQRFPDFNEILEFLSDRLLKEADFPIETTKDELLGLLESLQKIIDMPSNSRSHCEHTIKEELIRKSTHIHSVDSLAYNYFDDIIQHFNLFANFKNKDKRKCYELFCTSEFYKMGLCSFFSLPIEVNQWEDIPDNQKYARQYFSDHTISQEGKIFEHCIKQIQQTLDHSFYKMYKNFMPSVYKHFRTEWSNSKYYFYLNSVSEYHFTVVSLILFVMYYGALQKHEEEQYNVETALDFLFSYNKNIRVNKNNNQKNVAWELSQELENYKNYFTLGHKAIFGNQCHNKFEISEKKGSSKIGTYNEFIPFVNEVISELLTFKRFKSPKKESFQKLTKKLFREIMFAPMLRSKQEVQFNISENDISDVPAEHIKAFNKYLCEFKIINSLFDINNELMGIVGSEVEGQDMGMYIQYLDENLRFWENRTYQQHPIIFSKEEIFEDFYVIYDIFTSLYFLGSKNLDFSIIHPQAFFIRFNAANVNFKAFNRTIFNQDSWFDLKALELLQYSNSEIQEAILKGLNIYFHIKGRC